ncbi:Peptidoglycan-specific endopeptidase, M23 family [Granulibacter bethesdensis CGDNIH1]|uniref:Peptidoglycan-specific endopeptidase, M23 family n=2 Tax=Granulibacter bethesdensis TaxID=364410 RepID=Q0BRE1_GRABC|nr:Peptidoglycan-specific endopeptidase, M23 family [Granulibacter bethesdensis CGDNIH1]APH52466.1 Peptidoglycan-specific endopeptidase, M23 family [Granulibacter bethesdensis]APH65155.1 Peptidoglycan-specific endopeptidase, M23 family [Granulibacter bethesdensis]
MTQDRKESASALASCRAGWYQKWSGILPALVTACIIAMMPYGPALAVKRRSPAHTAPPSGTPAGTSPASPEQAQAALNRAEHERARQEAARKRAEQEAAIAAQQEAKIAEARAAAAIHLREADEAVAAIADRMADLARQRQAAEKTLAARAADLAPMLPLIERLSLYPAETLLAVPEPPERALRGLLVLQGLSRQLEESAQALRAERAKVDALAASIRKEASTLAEAQARQKTEAHTLDEKLASIRSEIRSARNAAAEAAQQAAASAQKADSLRDVIARLEEARRQEEAKAAAEARRAEKARQQQAADQARQKEAEIAAPAGPGLSEQTASPPPSGRSGTGGMPVAGTLVRTFGAPSEAGGSASGMTFSTAPQARVLAPCEGRVVFAGPFRSYGQLVILDCGRRYHFVLAGMEKLDASVGRHVAPGEPIGQMAGWDPAASAAARPQLYVELRHEGSAIDPRPWLRGR